MLVIGLMSGTSLDGIDAALVELDGTVAAPEWRIRSFIDVPYSAAQRTAIHDGMVHGDAASLCRLNADIGEWFADAALRVLAHAGVTADDIHVIGTHGQTIWHEPPRDGRRGSTLQLGCAATIAERTGIDVVSDFRSRDMAAGGEGAPLVPWVDRLLFSHPTRRRVLQNIGGMGNLTWLPPRGSTEPVLAFDTGPGNALIDAAVELASSGESTFDRDGQWAAEGTPDDALLAELLAHPFLQRSPPKSTGREVFGRPYVQRLAERVAPRNRQEWASFICTLTELSARSIAGAIERWVLPRGIDEIVITGGGALNGELVERIRRRLPAVEVTAEGNALGIDPAAKEALAFAVLAWAHVHGVAGNVPEATGARGPRVLGCHTPGRRREHVSEELVKP
ncbi:MAG TPA: anhydro-N-acetylmuramic acid kinase [Longimicrobiales bacterium]|nr:anhydro-N-acetylmuramic acid kinase [Longimicrobiales bacterium]